LTPNAVATATLNRYGPDTKAAIVLTGVNRLLREATEAVAAVSRHLADCDVDPQLRLAVWAGLVLEVYRGQPALVVAALQARAVQRSLTSQWGAHVVTDAVAGSEGGARSELPVSSANAGLSMGPDAASTNTGQDDPLRPVRLDLVDATLPLLRLQVTSAGAEQSGASPIVDMPSDQLEDIADAWCRRLLQCGRPGRGLVWLTEDEGHRQVHVYLRVGAVVAPFVAEVLGGAVSPRLADPPPLPDAVALAAAPVYHRRAHLLATHVAANFLRYRDELLQTFPTVRERTRNRVADATRLGTEVLGPHDPATLLVRGYQVYLDLWDRFRRAVPQTAGLDDDLDRVQAFQVDLLAAASSGEIDPGAVTYLLELGSVALARARSFVAVPSAVDRLLSRSWGTCLAARGLVANDVVADPQQVHPSQVFHLHHFAEYIAVRGRPVDLRRALALQERVCSVRDDVARREPVGYPAKHAAARTAHELAASLALRLAQALPDRDRKARSAAGATAARHALAVLDSPSTEDLLLTAEPCGAVVTTARAVLPALDDALGQLEAWHRERARALAEAAANLLSGAEARRFRAFVRRAS
jgi:hypothetical protein